MAKKPAASLGNLKKQSNSELSTSSGEPQSAPTTGRGSVQTVRMSAEQVRALKLASLNRGISQQDIMLNAILRDLELVQD